MADDAVDDELTDAELTWQLGPRTIAHDYRVFAAGFVEGSHPRTGARKRFSVLACRDWVNVIAVTTDDRIVLVRQFRVGTARVGLEIPGGIIEPGESPVEAGARELAEETGYTGGVAELIGTVAPNPAIQGNALYTVVIRGVARTQAPTPDDGEVLAVELMTKPACVEAVRDGRIEHALVVAGLAHLAFRGEL